MIIRSLIEPLAEVIERHQASSPRGLALEILKYFSDQQQVTLTYPDPDACDYPFEKMSELIEDALLWDHTAIYPIYAQIEMFEPVYHLQIINGKAEVISTNV